MKRVCEVTNVPIRRALVSVYDKTGLAELAGALAAAGVQIVSTGSTAAAIAAAGVPVTGVADVTGFPECLEGRVKTLHPAIHAGLLADTGRPGHAEQLAELGIDTFELLVSNLYPFEATVAGGGSPAECVEQIDIGGPAMVRAAAKNHARVAVITDPSQYQAAAEAVQAGGFTREQRQRLAAAAYAATARYDAAVASWFAAAYAPDDVARETGWPDLVTAVWTRREVLRYGENPHQGAALYVRPGAPPGLATATQLHGKAMSFNNYGDAAAAWRTAFDFAEPCVAIIKHANPCGIAIGADLARGAPQGPRVRPGVGLWRGDRGQRRGHRGDGGPGRGHLHRGARRTGLRGRRAGDAQGQEEPAAAVLPRPGQTAPAQAQRQPRPRPSTAQPGPSTAQAPPQVEWRPVDGGVLLQTADRLDAPGTTPSPGNSRLAGR